MSNYILKISGAGNRFLLVDKQNFNKAQLELDWGKNIYKTDHSFEDFTALAQLDISNRKSFLNNLISQPSLSLMDGLIVLKRNSESRFDCDFYNKDGSKAEMCGNAACCVSVYAEWLNFPLKNLVLGETKLSCLKEGGVILQETNTSILELKEKDCKFHFINTGVPHGVIECPDELSFSNKIELKKLAQKLRYKNINGNKGMNVSFYQVIKKNHLKAISYERGIEDWTLACGTGALASALVYLHKQSIKKSSDVFVEMPGGKLKIQTQPYLALFSSIKKGF